jgi:hypothetical protein
MLDSYVAWLAQAARREPDGLGAIRESDAIAGNYPHEPRERVSDETIMLVTAVEEVVTRGLTVRVETEKGQMLVFPSELRTDLPDYPDGYDLELAFSFAGPVPAIYSAIAVRLINSLSWGRNYHLFRSAAIFREAGDPESVCGFAVRFSSADEESEGRIIAFFEGAVSRERKLSFLRYIDYQLQQMAVAGSVTRERLYSCCGIAVSEDVVLKRTQRGERTVVCGVCLRHIPMDDLATRTGHADRETRETQEQALTEQSRQQRLATFPVRANTRRFDAFICYSSLDRRIVLTLYRELTDQGILCWFDEEWTSGGTPVAGQLEHIIDSVPNVILACGPSSMGPWQEQEYYAFLNRALSRRPESRPLSLFPVLLPGTSGIQDLPTFARTYPVTDLRRESSQEMNRLIQWMYGPKLHG